MPLAALELCARTTAAWHAAWLAALGLRSEERDDVWRALDAPPFIYWAAITLSPRVPAAAVADAPGTICDSWNLLDLTPFGFVRDEREPWLVRRPGPLTAEPAPAELELVRVSTAAQVRELEAVSVRGFGGEGASVEPGELHPAAILGEERLTMLVGRVDGEAVAAGMSYRADDAVGIYGVTTVAPARGRGYASALTRALIDPGLPALLSPSPEAERLYRRLGFEQVGELRQWRPRGSVSPGGHQI